MAVAEDGKRPLWAPWRVAYIRGPKSAQCIFCTSPRQASGREELIVHRGERCYVLLNAFPYAPGHLMVAPYRHVGELDALDDDELLELQTLTRDCVRALRRAFAADGFNIGINLGKVAGAGFAAHLHQHVVPRWQGDNNFMPVIADTRVINQSLEAARQEILAAWPTAAASASGPRGGGRSAESDGASG